MNNPLAFHQRATTQQAIYQAPFSSLALHTGSAQLGLTSGFPPFGLLTNFSPFGILARRRDLDITAAARPRMPDILTIERPAIQESSADQRLIAAGIAPPLPREYGLAGPSGRTPGTAPRRGAPAQPEDPGIAAQEQERRPLAQLVNRLQEIRAANPDASDLELATLLRGTLPPPGTLRTLLPPVPRDPENELNEFMWMRFGHEYNMLSLGLQDGFSDAVSAWLDRVIHDWLQPLFWALRSGENDTTG